MKWDGMDAHNLIKIENLFCAFLFFQIFSNSCADITTYMYNATLIQTVPC